MKHSPSLYALALLEIQEKLLTAAAFRNFLRILRKNNDLVKLPRILSELKKQYRKKYGTKDVEIALARQDETVAREVQHELKLKTEPRVIIRKEILGGVAITINDELLIDGSIKTRMLKLWGRYEISSL